MGFLSRLFGGRAHDDEQESPSGSAAREEEIQGEPEEIIDPGSARQSVVAWLRLGDAEFTQEREQIRLFRLADRVMRALEESGVGTYENNDLERGFYRMYLHGPDARAIVEVVEPILREDAPPGSYLATRAGPKGTSEERLEL